MQWHRFMLIPLLVLLAQSQSEEPHAVVNGKQVSLSEVQGLMDDKMPPELRNPAGLFRYYGFIDRLAAKAEAAKLAEKSPYKEQLELMRKQILATAELNEVCNNSPVADADIEAYFAQHKEDYAMARVQALFIPQKGSADEALAKARQLAAQLKSGQGVADLLTQYPAGFNTVMKGDRGTVEAIRTAVFALKAGEVSAPIPQKNGVYVLRVESFSDPQLNDARPYIWRIVADAHCAAWQQEVQKSVTVTK